MIIVTAGNKYIDIDAYASGIAYALLLNSLGIESKFVSSGNLNSSVCELVKKLGYSIDRNYTRNANDRFVLVDLSNPEFFDKIVDTDRIEEIIDHHAGYKDMWDKKSVKNQIEFIGSVATIIYERIVDKKQQKLLTKNLCKLLISAILDNTLNLKSSITTNRDREAYFELKRIGKIEDNFDQAYFDSCEEYLKKDIVSCISNDIKQEDTKGVLPLNIGQLTIYNVEIALGQKNEIVSYFNKNYNEWFLNIICIKDGKSYILSSKNCNQKLENFFCCKFNDSNMIVLDKFLLRKQIIKKALCA